MKKKLEIKPFDPSKAFDDSSLPNQEGKPLSKERSEYIESIMMPLINTELARLRIEQPDLFIHRT